MVSWTAPVEVMPAIMMMMIEITTDVGSTLGSRMRMAAAAVDARIPAAIWMKKEGHRSEPNFCIMNTSVR